MHIAYTTTFKLKKCTEIQLHCLQGKVDRIKGRRRAPASYAANGWLQYRQKQIKPDITGKCIKAGVYMNFASLDRI